MCVDFVYLYVVVFVLELSVHERVCVNLVRICMCVCWVEYLCMLFTWMTTATTTTAITKQSNHHVFIRVLYYFFYIFLLISSWFVNYVCFVVFIISVLYKSFLLLLFVCIFVNYFPFFVVSSHWIETTGRRMKIQRKEENVTMNNGKK